MVQPKSPATATQDLPWRQENLTDRGHSCVGRSLQNNHHGRTPITARICSEGKWSVKFRSNGQDSVTEPALTQHSTTLPTKHRTRSQKGPGKPPWRSAPRARGDPASPRRGEERALPPERGRRRLGVTAGLCCNARLRPTGPAMSSGAIKWLDAKRG